MQYTNILMEKMKSIWKTQMLILKPDLIHVFLKIDSWYLRKTVKLFQQKALSMKQINQWKIGDFY